MEYGRTQKSLPLPYREAKTLRVESRVGKEGQGQQRGVKVQKSHRVGEVAQLVKYLLDKFISPPLT